MERLILGRDVDRLCARPRGWATHQARAGKIPHLRLPDGQIRFCPLAIENWLSSLAVASVHHRMGVPGDN